MLETEKLQEKINLAQAQIEKYKQHIAYFPKRVKRINFISALLEGFMKITRPQELYSLLPEKTHLFFKTADIIAFFIFNRKEYSLELINSFKKDSQQIIKEKNGDIIDWWVLKHGQTLLIDDIGNDFRFDPNKCLSFQDRKNRSILASPLVVKNNLYGVIRIEAKRTHRFNLEDARILRTIAELAAISLDKTYLFEKTEKIAIQDSLTKLFLRNYFKQRIEEEILRYKKSKRCFGIIMADIDDFKKINDTYGHPAGDLVLKKVAGIINKITADSGNISCRFGGEEFVSLVVNTDENGIFQLAQLIKNTVEQKEISFRRRKVNFTISAGIALYRGKENTFEEIIASADKALYRAKKGGKNKVCIAQG